MAQRTARLNRIRDSHAGFGVDKTLGGQEARVEADKRSSVTRLASPRSGTHLKESTPSTQQSREWRCRACGKLLGLYQGTELHVRFSRGHEFFASFPARAICCGCGCTNRAILPQETSRSDND